METKSPPPFLPPRTPYWRHNEDKRSSWPSSRSDQQNRSKTPPPFQPQQRPYSLRLQQSLDNATTSSGATRPTITSTRSFRSRRSSLQSIPDDVELGTPSEAESNVARSNSEGRKRLRRNRPYRVASGTARNAGQLQVVTDNQHVISGSHGALRRNSVQRHSALRIEQTLDDNATEDVDESVRSARSDALRALESRQPCNDLVPRPRISLKRLSSLDNIMTYREEVAAWKRASSVWEQQQSEWQQVESELHSNRSRESTVDVNAAEAIDCSEKQAVEFPPESPCDEVGRPPAPEPPSTVASSAPSLHETSNNEEAFPFKNTSEAESKTKFRHPVTEMGFTFAIAMSQLLGEFLISGFALELSKLATAKAYDLGGTLGLFWPASLLSLILSATLLVFARLSDMYSGYPLFMFGLIWLTIWTLVPAFVPTVVVLDVSRAMQGLAIAAFTPSTFVMVGTVYEDGPRKNFVLGLYSGCAPLGFFAGFLTAGALKNEQAFWWFWIVAALSALTAVVSWLCVPHDRTNRKQAGLQMDWAGAFLITAGLILVAYALAVSTYETSGAGSHIAATPIFYAPFAAGAVCLLLAVWVEGWWAKTPLLPFDFFKPRSVKAFCLAGLFFYASYGAWLYTTTDFFESTSGTVSTPGTQGITGITLAIWYTPTAIGGVMMCVLTGALLHIVPPKLLLLISGLAWIGASLIFAACPYPINYWSMVLPSMICATLGLDLTYTVSLVYLSSVQPDELQGLCGAICSILINLAMSFSLSIVEIVKNGASSHYTSTSGVHSPDGKDQWIFRSAFIYGAASAAVGFVISVVFVRIAKAKAKVVDEEQPAVPDTDQLRAGSRSGSEVTTLVDGQEKPDGMATAVNSAELER